MLAVAFATIFFTLSSAQADLLSLFHQLKNNRDVNYEVIGAVCEQVAALQLKEEYGKNYDVTVGIRYFNNQRTIGELDVVVMRRNDGEAVLVGEVKCWRDLNSARHKAVTQLQRFRSHAENKKSQFDMYSDGTHQYYKKSQFDEHPTYIGIAQNGARKAGFEKSLGYSLEEMMRLRKMLLDCHKRGHCDPRSSQQQSKRQQR